MYGLEIMKYLIKIGDSFNIRFASLEISCLYNSEIKYL